jgi:hypothetical protein
MDMYNKRVDELVKRDLTCDWEMVKRWYQNMVWEILHICNNAKESSSVVTNATNGIEPTFTQLLPN